MARHRKVHMAPWRKPSYKVRSMRSVTQCSGRREQTRQRGQNCCRARNSKAPRRRTHRALREGAGKLARWESAGYVSHVRGGRGEKVVDSSRNAQGSVSARSSASKGGQIVMA